MDTYLKPTEQTPVVASDSHYLGAEHFNRPSEELGPREPDAHSARVWLDRVWMVLYVAFCIEVGILLAILPWYGRVWTDNTFIMAHPLLRAFAADNFTRGVVTGLGLVDIWLGIAAAVHYREPQPPKKQVPPASS